jgi:hypothetical protein
LLKLAEPLVVRASRKENVRILAELKRYVEAQPKQRDLNPSLPEIVMIDSVDQNPAPKRTALGSDAYSIIIRL